MSVFNLIFIPFAWLLRSLYFLLNSYGMAIVFFCLITKVLLFPLSLKGKKSMIRMNALSSKQQLLQKQYGKDKARLNAEIQKLYEKEKVNPMGGCLWSLLPLPILIGLYGVIRQPLTYLMNMTSDEISELSNYLFGSVISRAGTGEIKIAEELFHRLSEVTAALPAFADKLFSLDFTFLGLNLATTPQWNPTKFDAISWNNIGLFLIPLVSAVLALLSMQISMKTNQTANNKDNPMAGNTKTMMMTMPLISLWIGFTLPAALGIYWIANNVFTMLQELIAGKLLKKDFEAAAREREDRERQEKEEEKERKRQASEAKAKAAAEGKKRLAERKVSGEVLANSRIGIRAYARGRAYDPNRFGSVTPYRDPASPVDEAAMEAALAAKSNQTSDSGQEEDAAVSAPAVPEILAAAADADTVPVSDTAVYTAPNIVPGIEKPRISGNDDYEAEAEDEAESEAEESKEDEEK